MARTPPGYYLHLIAWAQIGVLIRVYFAELFGGACTIVPWAPCLTNSGNRWGGAFFTDIVSNVVGSFLMGLFVSSDVLSNSLKHILSVEAPMAMLPVRSPLQEHMAFQVGLRTGLCGSLTTFASWLTQVVLMIVGGKQTAVMQHTQWVEALGGLLVGTLAALAALVLGQHCALYLYHILNPGAFIPYGSPAPEQDKVDGLDQQQEQQQGGTENWAETPDGLSDSRQLRTVSSIRQGSLTVVVVESGQQQQQQQWDQEGQRLQSLESLQQQQTVREKGAAMQPSIQLSAVPDSRRSISSSSWRQQAAVSPKAAAAAAGAAADIQQQQQQQLQQQKSAFEQLSSAGTVSNGAAAAAEEELFVNEVDEEEQPSVSAAQVVVDGFAMVTIVVLTGVSLWRIIQGSIGYLPGHDDPFSQEWLFWSILFGPLGCYGRYYLSRYNGRMSGKWKWFPVGTFAANMTACVIDYVMKVVPVRHPLDHVSVAVLAGVVGGVGGCLSTVSTWVVEIQRLLLSFPKTSHGYQYIFISLGTAVALGLTIYGIPVWTMS